MRGEKKGDKEKPGCLTNLLALCLFGGLSVWGVKSCSELIISPDTPEQAPRRQEDEAAKAERWRPEEAKQDDRIKLIEELVDKGVFHKVDIRNSAATIWVDTPFYALDFQAKQEFCSVVHAYISTQAKSESISVQLKDARSGKKVGDYGKQWTGFGLNME